jgi:hypothetical protein
VRRREARQLVAARSSLELKRLQRLQKLKCIWKQWKMLDRNDRSRISDLINALDFLQPKCTPLVSSEPESKLDVDGDWDPLSDVTQLLILVAESITEESIENESIDAQDQVFWMRRCSLYSSNIYFRIEPKFYLLKTNKAHYTRMPFHLQLIAYKILPSP